MTTETEIIKTQNLTYRYPGSSENVIGNVDFSMKKGQRIAIIGKSGGGKSTLLKLFAGLLNNFSGKIINNSNSQGYMFQDAYLYPWLNVYDNVTLGLRISKKEVKRERINEILHWAGIEDCIEHSASALSGGQRQRVALARTLVIQPDIIMLDEPFASVDPETSAKLCADITRYSKQKNVALLLVTHNYDEASIMADEIYQLEHENIDGLRQTRLRKVSQPLLQMKNRPSKSIAMPQDAVKESETEKLDIIPRRKFIHQATVSALSAAVLYGFQKKQALASEAEFDEIVRIGYLPITDATALLIAHAGGFFADQGLKSVKPTLIRSWSTLTEAFVANKFNLVHLLKPIPIWMKFKHNIPVKIVAWAHTNGSAIVVGGHSKVTSIEQLGKSNIAVPYWYSIHNIILQKMLRNAGLRPVIKDQSDVLADDEVNLQILPPPEMPLALLAKKIDGYIVAEPFNALGELKAKARLLRFTGDVWKNHPCCVVTMHEKHLNQHQQWSQKVVNAIVNAEHFARNNREETAKILSKQGSSMLPFGEKIIQRAMNHYNVEQYRKTGALQNVAQWRNNRIDFQPYPYHSATKYIIDAMRDTLVEGNKNFLDDLDTETAARAIIDDRYVKNSLGITDAYQRQEVFRL